MSVYCEKAYGENSSAAAFYYAFLSIPVIGRSYIFKLLSQVAS